MEVQYAEFETASDGDGEYAGLVYSEAEVQAFISARDASRTIEAYSQDEIKHLFCNITGNQDALTNADLN
jgi:hypothetical protein